MDLRSGRNSSGTPRGEDDRRSRSTSPEQLENETGTQSQPELPVLPPPPTPQLAILYVNTAERPSMPRNEIYHY